MLKKIQSLLCYKTVEFTSKEICLIKEMNLSRNIRKDGENKYSIAYSKEEALKHTNEHEIMQDASFLLKLYNSSEEVQHFLSWLFEAKAHYLKTFYLKGYKNFYSTLLND